MTDRPAPPGPDGEARLRDMASGVAKLAVASWWHVAARSLDAGINGTSHVLERVMAGKPQDTSAAELRRRGAELIRRSNDVQAGDDTHPAFAHILDEITPDEARILRLLYLDGPQPAVDVRTNRPLGIGSELVAGGLNMIGEHAGCVNVERVHPYLTNLARLGLLDFSKEQVGDPTRYQVVEAQPRVVAAVKQAGRMPRIVQRRIQLTRFGEDFVRTCLPVEGPHRPSPGPHAP